MREHDFNPSKAFLKTIKTRRQNKMNGIISFFFKHLKYLREIQNLALTLSAFISRELSCDKQISI